MRDAFGDRTITRVELDGRGFLTVLGGFLLLLPGFLTDIVGALLLLPPVQHWIRAALRRALQGAERASAPADVVDLPPDQWRRAARRAPRPQAISRSGLKKFGILVAFWRVC